MQFPQCRIAAQLQTGQGQGTDIQILQQGTHTDVQFPYAISVYGQLLQLPVSRQIDLCDTGIAAAQLLKSRKCLNPFDAADLWPPVEGKNAHGITFFLG